MRYSRGVGLCLLDALFLVEFWFELKMSFVGNSGCSSES